MLCIGARVAFLSLNASYGAYQRLSCEYMEKPTVLQKLLCVSWHRDEIKQCIRLPWEILHFPRCVIHTEKLY